MTYGNIEVLMSDEQMIRYKGILANITPRFYDYSQEKGASKSVLCRPFFWYEYRIVLVSGVITNFKQEPFLHRRSTPTYLVNYTVYTKQPVIYLQCGTNEILANTIPEHRAGGLLLWKCPSKYRVHTGGDVQDHQVIVTRITPAAANCFHII